MKYCPYCGAELYAEAASFCTECGHAVSVERTTGNAAGKAAPRVDRRKNKKSAKRSKAEFEKRKAELLASDDKPQQETEADEYDGYYSDIVPSDLDREKEGPDTELIKKVVAIAGAMLLIIGLCVLAMYLL